MRTLNVAMVGHGFMGAAHSQGWRVAPRFFDLPAAPAMHLLVGRDPGAAGAAAERWGWHEATTNWRAAVTREDVDVVDVCTPGDSHAEIAIAALEAGKHVLCEKPLANTVEEAEAMAAAADRAAARGVVAMLGHTYRRLPATTFARDLVADGRLGEIYRVQAAYLQDWLADPTAPMTWRLRKDRAGSGSLGDVGAHIIDLTQFITGVPIAEVSGTLETLVRRRPERAPSDGAPAPLVEVTVDDTAVFMARFANGVLGTFEATRFATGRKNALRVEISGSKGALAFDLERLNELQLYDATAPGTERGFRTILVTEPGHPYAGAWWPPGHTLGYEHGFSHQVVDFTEAIAKGEQPTPSFEDGYQVQCVLDAVERSSAAGSAWTETTTA